MVFKKEKMLDRIKREGRLDMVDDNVLSIMDNLDGQEAHTNSWRRQVYGEPVLIVKGKDGTYCDVNELDCE